MTIGHQTPIVKYAYAGPANFAFNFKLLRKEDLSVIFTDGLTGISQQLFLGTDYTVNLNSSLQGGQVVIHYAKLIGTVEIRRSMLIDQPVDFVNNEKLDMEIVERAYDRLTMLIQQYLIELQRGLGLSNDRGEWEAGTLYKQGQLVSVSSRGGSIYLAANEHTSAVFDEDLAAGNWKLFINLVALSLLKDAAEASAASAAASAIASSTSAASAANSSVAASQYGVARGSTKRGTLTAVKQGPDVVCTTQAEFSDLISVSARGQQILDSFDATDIIKNIDGANKTFTIANYSSINDLSVVYVKSQPQPAGSLVSAQVLVPHAFEGSEERILLFDAVDTNAQGSFVDGVFTSTAPTNLLISLSWRFLFDGGSSDNKVLRVTLKHSTASGWVNHAVNAADFRNLPTDVERAGSFTTAIHMMPSETLMLTFYPSASGKVPENPVHADNSIDRRTGLNILSL